MQHFLDKKGLSMTQAQTVSNLCNQAANEMLRSWPMTMLTILFFVRSTRKSTRSG